VQLKLICIGKAKGPYRELSREYEKRISRYGRLVVRELSEVKYAGSPTPGEIIQILQREAAAIRRELTGRELVVALDAQGTSFSSVELAEWIQRQAAEGRAQMTFVIGGSLGLDDNLKREADLTLSLSAMTFPHQLARIVLLEQLYRALTITRNEPYHK